MLRNQRVCKLWIVQVRVLMLVFLLWTTSLVTCSVARAISGQVARCSNEGERVYVPLVASDPCYKCFCRQGLVECETNKCPSLEGCHAVLFNRPRGQCCDVCKGCTVGKTQKESGDVWYSNEDPCVISMCQAGVVTNSRVTCRPQCQNPVPVPGQCCPSCSGCYYNGVQHASGETFTLKKDPSVQCTCKGGHVTCFKRACTVLNCPEDKLYYERGEKCPKCEGHRKVFDTPRSCFFSKRVYNDGDFHILDNCTTCVCMQGTMICDRQQCPEISCPPKDQITIPGKCCPACKEKKSCKFGNVAVKHEETWDKDKCTVCTCRDGIIRCEPKTCSNPTSVCHQGYTLTYNTDTCCHVCTKSHGSCTLRGQSSNQIETFDGRKYLIFGFCTHDLIRDCGQGQLTVKVKYKTNTNFKRQIDIVTLRFGSTQIKLYRTSEIRINRTSLFSSHFMSSDFSLTIQPSRIIVKVKLGLSLTWNLKDRLTVKVSGDFFSSRRLCGLCGNFDGDPENELVNRKGSPVGYSSLMAQSWVRGRLCRQNPHETGRSMSGTRKHSHSNRLRHQKHKTDVSLRRKEEIGTKNSKNTAYSGDATEGFSYSKNNQLGKHADSLGMYFEYNTTDTTAEVDVGLTKRSPDTNNIIITSSTEEEMNVNKVTEKMNYVQAENTDKIVETEFYVQIENTDETAENKFNVQEENTDETVVDKFNSKVDNRDVIGENMFNSQTENTGETVKSENNIQSEKTDEAADNMKLNNHEVDVLKDMTEGSESCEDNTLEWTEARQACRAIRNLNLENCADVLEVASFMRSCIDTICQCRGDQICEETSLTSYIQTCKVNSQDITNSRKRTQDTRTIPSQWTS